MVCLLLLCGFCGYSWGLVFADVVWVLFDVGWVLVMWVCFGCWLFAILSVLFGLLMCLLLWGGCWCLCVYLSVLFDDFYLVLVTFDSICLLFACWICVCVFIWFYLAFVGFVFD